MSALDRVHCEGYTGGDKATRGILHSSCPFSPFYRCASPLNPMMSAPMTSNPVSQRKDSELSEQPLDPLPDETVVKAGWLSKKGRRGVRVIL